MGNGVFLGKGGGLELGVFGNLGKGGGGVRALAIGGMGEGVVGWGVGRREG